MIRGNSEQIDTNDQKLSESVEDWGLDCADEELLRNTAFENLSLDKLNSGIEETKLTRSQSFTLIEDHEIQAK